MVDTRADVVVVGGGIAGVSVAACLAPHVSVLLIEAEPQLAHHSTGRSAAAFLESYGSAEVQALTRASRPLLEAIAEHDDLAGPILSPRPLLWIAAFDQTAALDSLRSSTGGLEEVSLADVHAMCPAIRPGYLAGAAVEREAQDVDVLALHQHYVRTARAHGAAIHAQQRAVAGRHSARGWTVTTSTGDVSCTVVVNAAGAWADDVAQRFGLPPVGLTSLRRTALVARSRFAVDPTWPLVFDVEERFYFKPEGPNVLASPADETPDPPGDARPDEVDVALAIELVNEATLLDVRSVVSAWAGLRTFSDDANPVVGADPAEPSFVWLAGQGGYGIQMAPALGAVAAAAVTGAAPSMPLAADLAARVAPRRAQRSRSCNSSESRSIGSERSSEAIS